MKLTDKGLVVVLSGFSGAGKGTIMKNLLSAYPGEYDLSISATTRTPRMGEEDGRDYFFKSTKEFEEMIEEDGFLEYAKFNGNYYGTPRDYVERLVREGRVVLLEIEVQGALQVKKIYPHAILLFVTPPSAVELKDRLVGRGTEDKKTIADRLSISSKESYLMSKYDYLIINDSIEEAVDSVHGSITAERLKAERSDEMIHKMQKELKIYAKGE